MATNPFIHKSCMQNVVERINQRTEQVDKLALMTMVVLPDVDVGAEREAARQEGYRECQRDLKAVFRDEGSAYQMLDAISAIAGRAPPSGGGEGETRKEGCYWGHGCLQCSTCRLATEHTGYLRALADVEREFRDPVSGPVVAALCARLRQGEGK